MFKLQKSLLLRTTWHLNNRWDVFEAAIRDLAMFLVEHEVKVFKCSFTSSSRGAKKVPVAQYWSDACKNRLYQCKWAEAASHPEVLITVVVTHAVLGIAEVALGNTFILNSLINHFVPRIVPNDLNRQMYHISSSSSFFSSSRPPKGRCTLSPPLPLPPPDRPLASVQNTQPAAAPVVAHCTVLGPS